MKNKFLNIFRVIYYKLIGHDTFRVCTECGINTGNEQLYLDLKTRESFCKKCAKE